MGTSHQVLNEEVNATDGAENAPHIFDGGTHKDDGDDDNLSIGSGGTNKSNDVALFSKSIGELGKSHLIAVKLENDKKERGRLQIAQAQKATVRVEEKKVHLESLKMINSSRSRAVFNSAITELNCGKRSINTDKCKRMVEIGVNKASKSDPLVEGLTLNMDSIDEEIAQKKDQLSNSKLNADESSMATMLEYKTFLQCFPNHLTF